MSKYYSPSFGGFVDPAILGDKFPLDAIEVSDDHYHAAISGQIGGGVAHDNEALLIVDPNANLSLSDLKARKLAELSAAFAGNMAELKATYPADEIQSWFKQEAEARTHVADNAADVPLLRAMSTARGIAIDDLAARVIANADAWAALAGALIGKRQRYEDAVNAATDPATLAAITWV